MSAPPSSADDFGLVRVLEEDGSVVPGRSEGLPPLSLRRRLFEDMLLLRRLDERMMAKQRQGSVGFYGAVTGQEAVPIAAAHAARPTDWVFPALRECAFLLVRGFPLERYLAQIYGASGDVAKGRQMPSHMAGREANVVSWSSVIGPQLPQAVGAAMAAQRRGDEMVAIAFSGDGATSQGDFHAALNFAGVFGAPVVFIVQNNHWAISVPASRQTASENFAMKASAYGMPGVRVDGNDALAVYSAVHEAMERARSGQGPTLLECVTYRIGAHSSSDDPSLYRDPAEVERWKARDPVARLRAHLTREGALDVDTERSMRDAIDERIRDAIRDVEAMPPLEVTTMVDDVFETPPAHLEAQRAEILRYARPRE